MDYLIVGLNHQTSPLELREKLAFTPESQAEALKGVLSLEGVEEGVILSTCNRVEVYAAAESPSAAIASIQKHLADTHGLSSQELSSHWYAHVGEAAIRHGFRVAASLDSMIVGETQIQGQVKEAFEQAMTHQGTGVYLNQFMHRALFLGKKVRTDTEISAGSVSVGSAAVDLTKKIFGHLENKKIVLIGAGEIGELVLTCLRAEGVRDITLVNRTLERAQELANKCGPAQIASLDQVESVLLKADVVVASISVTEPFVTETMVNSLMADRKQNPIFFIDLGVPRNIDSTVNDLNNVYLYNIDDLQKVVEANRNLRMAEAKKAEEIIEKEAVMFYESVIHRRPTIAALGRKFHHIRKQEMEKTLKRLSHLSDEEKQSLEKCTEAIVNKILHDPILLLQSEEIKDKDHEFHHLLKKLFRLED